MKNIRLYETEVDYTSEKDIHEYPTVSYTKDSDKVWYKKINKFTCYYDITENQVGEEVVLASGVGAFDDIILNGKSLRTPVSASTIEVHAPASYGDVNTITFTEDSWVKSPTTPWTITFNKPLTENDMVCANVVIGGEAQPLCDGINFFIKIGMFSPLSSDNTQFISHITTNFINTDFNVNVFAFTSKDDA